MKQSLSDADKLMAEQMKHVEGFRGGGKPAAAGGAALKQPTRVVVFGYDVLGDFTSIAYYDECPLCEVGKLVVVRGASGFAQPCDIGYRCTYCGVEADYYPPSFGFRAEGENLPPGLSMMDTVRLDTRKPMENFWARAMDRAAFEILLQDSYSHWLGIKAIVPRVRDITVVIFADGSFMYRSGDSVVRVWQFKDERR